MTSLAKCVVASLYHLPPQLKPGFSKISPGGIIASGAKRLTHQRFASEKPLYLLLGLGRLAR
jgi:hypothetical protein